MVDIPLQIGGFGNALSQGAHAGYYNAERRLKANEEQRRQDSQQYIAPAMKGDQDALAKLAAGDPKTTAVLIQNMGRLDEQKRAHMKEVADFSALGSNTILQTPPKERAGIYKAWYDEGLRRGYDMSRYTPDYGPHIDPVLRTDRGLSTKILELDQKDREEQGRNARHNNPTSVGGGPAGVEPLPGAAPSAPPAAAPAPMPGRPSASVAPAGSPPTQVAEAPPGVATGQAIAIPDTHAQSTGPVRPEGVTPGAPPIGGPAPNVPALPTTPNIVHFDPTEHGGQMRFFVANPQKGLPRRPAIHEGGYVQYTLPNGVDVFYQPKEKPPKPTGPEGPFAGNGIESQYANILMRGDPGSPEYSLAYAHFSRGHTSYDAEGKPITVQPMDMSPFRKPTYAAAPALEGQPSPAVAGAPGAAPGGSTGGPGISVGAPTPGRSPATSTEMAKYRDMQAEGQTIVTALEDFRKELKNAGGWDKAKSMLGSNTPLNTSFNNAALLAKGDALFNLGVLNGPDLDIIRRTLPDPSSWRSGITSDKDANASIDKVIGLINTRLSEKAKTLGAEAPKLNTGAQKGPQGADRQGLLRDAADAIRRGAPRDKVEQRLKEKGVDPSELPK